MIPTGGCTRTAALPPESFAYAANTIAQWSYQRDGAHNPAQELWVLERSRREAPTMAELIKNLFLAIIPGGSYFLLGLLLL